MNNSERKELETIFSTFFNMAINEERKQKTKTQSDIEEAVLSLGTFRDAMLKNGFSKEFTETLLLEIIKKAIEKGEF